MDKPHLPNGLSASAVGGVKAILISLKSAQEDIITYLTYVGKINWAQQKT